MEKPAVMFSEQGWKMFLNFMKDMQQGSEPEDSFVDNVVNNYYKRDDKPTVKESASSDTLYDMDDVSKVIVEALKINGNIPLNSNDIHEVLANAGFDYNIRGITPVMRGVMNRYEEVEKIGTGEYQWIGEV